MAELVARFRRRDRPQDTELRMAGSRELERQAKQELHRRRQAEARRQADARRQQLELERLTEVAAGHVSAALLEGGEYIRPLLGMLEVTRPHLEIVGQFMRMEALGRRATALEHQAWVALRPLPPVYRMEALQTAWAGHLVSPQEPPDVP